MSKSHNSDGPLSSLCIGPDGQRDFAPRLLNGSQAKTAYALRLNCEKMIAEAGLECVGFLTLTVGDQTHDGFKQVKDAAEASRRINNLNRRVLADLFERAVIVTERHRSGAIHFHVLGVLRGRPDIRTGFDFKAVAFRDYRSASYALRRIWKHLRKIAPGYGFGRSELLPIKKTGAAVASYVSKYIEKTVYNRTADDKRKKLVRYIGWKPRRKVEEEDEEWAAVNKRKGTQLKPNEFGWGSKRASAWRFKTRQLAGMVGVTEPEQAAEAFGPRWACYLSTLWRHYCGPDLVENRIHLSPAEFFTIQAELKRAAAQWLKNAEKPRGKIDLETLRDCAAWGKMREHNSDGRENLVGHAMSEVAETRRDESVCCPCAG